MARAANTRDQIIDRAFQLTLQRGFNGFSYRDISTPLGVKNAAIHYHFPSKMDLAMAMIQENHDYLKKNTSEFMAYGGSAIEQLEGMFAFSRQQYKNGRPVCLPGAMAVNYEEFSGETREAMEKFMLDTAEWLTRVLKTGREQGEFEFKGCARSKAASILAMMQGSRQLARIFGQEFLESMYQQVRTDVGISD